MVAFKKAPEPQTKPATTFVQQTPRDTRIYTTGTRIEETGLRQAELSFVVVMSFLCCYPLVLETCNMVERENEKKEKKNRW